jgi:hypothetical protein
MARMQEIILSSASWQDVKTVSEIDSQNCIQFLIFDAVFLNFVRLFPPLNDPERSAQSDERAPYGLARIWIKASGLPLRPRR